MSTQLYLQLRQQLSQLIQPRDKRHLDGFTEMLSALLLTGSTLMSQWLVARRQKPNRNDTRAALARWHYWLTKANVDVETYYHPLLQQALNEMAGQRLFLSLDTSLLWNRFCLSMVALRWGGRAIPLCWQIREHSSASVAFNDYQPLLAQAKALLPDSCSLVLLADRGFDHLALVDYLRSEGWGFAIRLRGNRRFWLNNKPTSVKAIDPGAGRVKGVCDLQVQRDGDVRCNLVVGTPLGSRQRWAVMTSEAPSLEVFEQYSWRFQIEAFFADLKSNQLTLCDSKLRNPVALERLMAVMAAGVLWAVQQGQAVVTSGYRRRVDAHTTRGLSYLKLGLRWLQGVVLQAWPLLATKPLEPERQERAMASRRQRLRREMAIEFSHLDFPKPQAGAA